MAGAGYKLFNTGDVLTAAQVNTYLMEQTVMVFDDAAARTTALSGVVSEGMISYLKDTNAVEVYNGASWVASDDPNAIQNTIVDAKGDLISATAADTPARLASSGNNGDVLTVDTSTSTGLKWAAPAAGGDTFAAGKNGVINGAFNIWQRGTSFTGGTDYGADRWQAYRNTSGSTFTRQTVSDSTNLPFIQYCGRAQRNNGTTSTSDIFWLQTIETANSVRFAGKNVVLSFYARAGANYSAASSALKVRLYSGTGTDENTATGFTGSATPIDTSVTLTTTWQRFQVTGTVASTATELGIWIYYTPVGTAGAADYFEVTGVQLEAGSTATDFQMAGGNIAGELAACQRYYEEGDGFFVGYSAGGNIGTWTSFNTTKRATPTVTITSSGAVSIGAVSGTALAKNGFNAYATVSGTNTGQTSYYWKASIEL